MARATSGYAALERGGPLVPFSFERRELRPRDVALKVTFCGVCHTDLHCIGKWGQEFPLVPGHEIAGEVIEVGSDVTGFAVGDSALIGTIVDSCRECEACLAGEESYCHAYPTLTFDGIDRIDKTRTRGGYSSQYVADERFVHKLPRGMDPAGAAPLLCAGITTYSALRHWHVGPGMVVGLVGLGGLGHLGVKFARAMGAHVVAFTTSQAKVEAALALGAHEVVLSRDGPQMAAQARRFDFILDTVAVPYPMDAMLMALKRNATLCSVGIPDRHEFSPIMLAMGRRSIASSGSGGTIETREMLDFCAKHQIVSDYELITPPQLATAFDRLERGDVRYRFVLDLTTAR
jgi:uncharacterized zinc-type alcohol dehydrogenase-like protein